MDERQERSEKVAGRAGDGRQGQNEHATAHNISDHLANERTLLAWVRTAVAIIGLGFVVAKFALYLRILAANNGPVPPASSRSTALGVALVGFGAGIVLLALVRYLVNWRLIQQGTYRPSPWIAVVVAALVAGGAIIMMLFLLTSTL